MLSLIATVDLTSPKVMSKSLCKSQFPHKSVILSFIFTYLKIKSTNLCKNWLLKTDLGKHFLVGEIALHHLRLVFGLTGFVFMEEGFRGLRVWGMRVWG